MCVESEVSNVSFTVSKFLTYSQDEKIGMSLTEQIASTTQTLELAGEDLKMLIIICFQIYRKRWL